jgi:hypothetical protein
MYICAEATTHMGCNTHFTPLWPTCHWYAERLTLSVFECKLGFNNGKIAKAYLLKKTLRLKAQAKASTLVVSACPSQLISAPDCYLSIAAQELHALGGALQGGVGWERALLAQQLSLLDILYVINLGPLPSFLPFFPQSQSQWSSFAGVSFPPRISFPWPRSLLLPLCFSPQKPTQEPGSHPAHHNE